MFLTFVNVTYFTIVKNIQKNSIKDSLIRKSCNEYKVKITIIINEDTHIVT